MHIATKIIAVLTITALMTDSVVAADLSRTILAAPVGAGASGGAQQTIRDNNSLLLTSTPTPTPTPAGANPAVKKSLTPGAAQMLNPPPLPPKSNALQQLTPGVNQTLNPQPLPPKVNAAGKLPTQVQPVTGATNNKLTATATKLPNGLFNMDDRAIIIVSGKQVSAGSVKQAINAAIAKQSGPPKTVKGGTRKLDLAAMGVGKASVKGEPPSTMQQSINPPNKKTLATAQSTSVAMAPSDRFKKTTVSNNGIDSLSALKCRDKGPPKISEVEGKLMPGAKVRLWGLCFGDRPGRVEVIGQFPGGKLTPAFTAWDMTNIDLEIPANVRGATDHAVSVTVVTADGKTSTAMQGQFVAARERVDVPESRWSPTAGFDKTDAGDMSMSSNSAYSGTLAKSVRVNPQCVLDTMDVLVLAGGVSGIHGFEQGQPNEASVTIDWQGACTGATIWTKHQDFIISQGDDVSFRSACHIAMQAKAWAYCPVGVAP